MKRLAAGLGVVLPIAATFTMGAVAQAPDAPYFFELRWRLVGPHRAGRVWWVTGVPDDARTYYAGTGALWESTNGGTTWASISDRLPTTGVGAVAVAASNPEVLYVGTGNNTLGSGVYRSNDAGGTWRPVGLADTKFITGLLIDPRNPDVVIAAAGAGGNFGTMVFYNNNPSPARGVYRTSDGGLTWAHTLFADNDTPAVDLATDPARPDIVYASLTNGLYRSDDGGQAWTKLAAEGLRATGTTIAVAPNTGARRIYAMAGGRRDDQVVGLREAARRASAGSGPIAAAVSAFDKAAVATITALAGNRGLAGRLGDLQFADLRPTPSTVAAVQVDCVRADDTLRRYREVLAGDLATLSAALTSAGATTIPSPTASLAPPAGPG